MEKELCFITKDGKSVFENDFIEIEITYEQNIVVVQFSLLAQGKFYPCESIEPINCSYLCNDEKKCPYEEDTKIVVSCISNYFAGKEREKNLEKAKAWCIAESNDEDLASFLDCRWVI